jgi:hypothetical protein
VWVVDGGHCGASIGQGCLESPCASGEKAEKNEERSVHCWAEPNACTNLHQKLHHLDHSHSHVTLQDPMLALTMDPVGCRLATNKVLLRTICAAKVLCLLPLHYDGRPCLRCQVSGIGIRTVVVADAIELELSGLNSQQSINRSGSGVACPLLHGASYSLCS